MNRCSDYWVLDKAWRKAECDPEARRDGKALDLLLKMREHLHCCHQCRLWWLEMIEILKNGGKHE